MSEWRAVIDFSSALPKNFNREFTKHVGGQVTEQFLPLGIWQFYPWYVSISHYEMQVIGNKGEQVVMSLGDGSDHWKKFSDHWHDISRGACV